MQTKQQISRVRADESHPMKVKAIIEAHPLPLLDLLGLLSHKLALHNPLSLHLPLVNRFKQRQNHRLFSSLNPLPVTNNFKIDQFIVTGRVRLENDDKGLERGAVVLEVGPELGEDAPYDIVIVIFVLADRRDVNGKVVELAEEGRGGSHVGTLNPGPGELLLPVVYIDLLVHVDTEAGPVHGRREPIQSFRELLNWPVELKA